MHARHYSLHLHTYESRAIALIVIKKRLIEHNKEVSNHFPCKLLRGYQRGLTLEHGLSLYYIKLFLYGLRRASRGIILGILLGGSHCLHTTL